MISTKFFVIFDVNLHLHNMFIAESDTLLHMNMKGTQMKSNPW